MRKRVLTVDDKEYLLAIMETWLSEDFKCLQARNATQALSFAEKPDVAVIGTNLEGTMSGSELLDELKKRFGIPVMMLTSEYTSSTRIELLKRGADDVMTKPFHPEELQLRVKRLAKDREKSV